LRDIPGTTLVAFGSETGQDAIASADNGIAEAGWVIDGVLDSGGAEPVGDARVAAVGVMEKIRVLVGEVVGSAELTQDTTATCIIARQNRRLG
jgi:hypothetical protein